MGRRLLCVAVAVALLVGGWCLHQDPGPARQRAEAPNPFVAVTPQALPEATSGPAAQTTSIASAGLAGTAMPQGIRWGAPDGRWQISWGWAAIQGLSSAEVAVREEEGRWVAEHGAIHEVFERRANGIEHIITVNERPEALEVRIRVDADTRSWDFDGQPRVTLSRPGEGDLLEVQGLCVYDAENRKLKATLAHEPGTILISVEDEGATYPVTIDPLITQPAWTADPTTQSFTEFGTSRGSYERVFLFLGSAQGPAASAAWTLAAPVEGGYTYGVRVAGPGDVNGDGYSDIVTGDPNAGRARLYLGNTNGPSSAPAWNVTVSGSSYFGESLAAAGDVNRDGRSDLLVGAKGLSPNRGSVYLFTGTTTGLSSSPSVSITSPVYDDDFGASVASAGDVNGDGYLDVVVGAPRHSGQARWEGRAYLYLGTSAGLSSTPAWTADPADQESAAFGISVAGPGDLNQDGFADVLVGSRNYGASPGTGRAWLYFGSASGLSVSPGWVVEAPYAEAGQFGAVVASPGDLNGDGLRDVVVSAPYAVVPRGTGEYNPSNPGAVFVYLNSASGLSRTPSMMLAPADASETYFGRALAAAGDTNGDGRPDLLVGAPGWDRDYVSEKGRAYVYFGTSTRTAVPWLVSPAADARVGTSTPTLDWEDVTDPNGIQSYDVEVDDASDFSAPLRWSGSVFASQATTAPLPEGGYYWRVRARDTLGNLSDWSLSRRVYADGWAPSAPQPTSPVNDALQTPTATLRWNGPYDFSGVAACEIQVAQGSDFSGPIEWSTTSNNGVVVTSALPEGRHFWRIRARDTWGWTTAWVVASFIVESVPPSAPSLVSPAEGAVVTQGSTPFDWSDSTDANGIQDYTVQVDNETTFALPLSWTGAATRSQIEAPFFPGTQFYWRVGARDRAGNVTWSAAGRFTRAAGIPAAVSLNSPWYDTAVATSAVDLDWSDATDPDGIMGYEVLLSTTRTFDTILWTATTTVSRATTANLSEGIYYWIVRAQDGLGNLSDWSWVYRFTVDVTSPTTSTPVAPANGSTVYTSSPVLDWTDATDNSGSPSYEYQIDTESTFSAPLWTSGATGASVAYMSGFTDGQYYWRIRVRDAAGNATTYSATFRFVVDTAPPATPSMVSPAEGATVTTATPTLDWSDVVEPGGVTYEVAVDDDSYFGAPLAAASGLTASQWTAPWLGDSVLRYWRVRAVDSNGLASAWSATRTFTVDRGRGFYVGLGAGANGQIGVCRDEAAGFGWRTTWWLLDSNYNAVNGETRPAAGDLDGDGASELVVGRGRYNTNGGWFAIVDDQGTGFTVIRWIQLPFAAYNATNGETWPACGDIDGDGRDEIVIGLGTYTSQGGYFALYNDAATGYAFIGWKRVSWSQYNAANGETRPACGDVTGDGKAEVFIGLGRYPSYGGRVARYTSGSVAFSAWMRFSYSAYNSANGETWPACGDVDADGRDELCIGMGAYPAGGGYVQYVDDSVAKYRSLGLKRIAWTAYNGAVGETRPSLGPVMGGAGDETVIGLGAWEPAAGYVAVLDRAPGYGLRAWMRVPADNLTTSAGATRPSVRR